MSKQAVAGDSGEDTESHPEHRVSHLMDELADAYAERDRVQDVAPLGRGGIKPRVTNRVTFSTVPEDETREAVTDVLETEQFAWTTDGPGEYVVLGRAIQDLRELQKGDRIHLNSRRGPFKVFRVMEQAPEVLQRSDPAVTVELSNVDTDTDWMLVHWKNEPNPWAYVKTKDQYAKGGFRYRKVEQVERSGRIGPFRLYAPTHDHVSEGYQDRVMELVQDADDTGGLGEVHPSDVQRVRDLLGDRPAAEVFSPRDADTIREVLETVSEHHEREADALAIETDEDREDAAHHQGLAKEAEQFAAAFNLVNMEAIAHREDSKLWVCEDCEKAFADQYKYPTHRRDCPGREE